MTTYIDSSALVAVYVPERYSASARTTLTTVPQVPYTPLHELEVANAFALLLGRGSRFPRSSRRQSRPQAARIP